MRAERMPTYFKIPAAAVVNNEELLGALAKAGAQLMTDEPVSMRPAPSMPSAVSTPVAIKVPKKDGVKRARKAKPAKPKAAPGQAPSVDPQARRVYDAIKDGAKNKAEIISATGIKAAPLRRIMNLMLAGDLGEGLKVYRANDKKFAVYGTTQEEADARDPLRRRAPVEKKSGAVPPIKRKARKVVLDVVPSGGAEE